VLAISPSPVELPADLDAALGPGLANGGVAMKTLRWRQLAWLVEFLRAWKALDPEERRRALADPWVFKQVAFAVPVSQAYSQRNALLHLVFPGTFEPILSRDHKTAIVGAFTDRIGEPSDDVDRNLLAIRRSLEAEHSRPRPSLPDDPAGRHGGRPGPDLAVIDPAVAGGALLGRRPERAGPLWPACAARRRLSHCRAAGGRACGPG
jgi:5-methylcytosine-specific restriction protein B